MMVQVVGILMPLLTFSMAYNNFKAYNILAIMLDIHLKNMKGI